jgi:hypothetical protein
MKVTMAVSLSVAFLNVMMAVQTDAKTWMLENTPKQYRPKLCDDLRKEIKRDRAATSYKVAMKRKAACNLWRMHKERLEISANLDDAYRRLDCRNYR